MNLQKQSLKIDLNDIFGKKSHFNVFWPKGTENEVFQVL